MSSVWKRLQRVGKKASKFQFTASYQSLTVECVRGGKWQPNKLVVVWTRRKRRKLSKPMSWQPGISNPFRGIIVWPEPEPVEINVTLYKDPKPDSEFEDKEWTFVIEDEAQNGRRKPIATGAINMVDYASVESHTFDVTLTLKVASKKLVSASLELNLTCVLIKEGMATDDDMISIGSMMSLNDSYYFDDNDDDMEMAPSPRFHRRNISQGNMKVQAVTSLQETEFSRSRSPTASPVLGKKRGRIRSKSSLGENPKTLVNDLLKAEGMKRSSTDSDASADTSDSGQDTKDKSKMESELIKWARTCTKGYRGVKVKDMTTSWRDGLAFCAILHSFHPDKIEFSSLDATNIKENNKLAFTAFEKLGIPRLLDPTQMMFTTVPDKLCVMTYVYQIKNHFGRTRQPLPPSPLSLETSPRPRRLPVPPQMTVTSTEEPTEQDDAAVEDNDSGGDSKVAASKDSKEGSNPFSDDQEGDDEAAPSDLSTNPSASSSSEVNGSDTNSKQKIGTASSDASVDRKNSAEENEDKKKDILVTSDVKPPPKPPRIYQTDTKDDTSLKTDDNVNKKENTESKPYNPFDEDDNEDVKENNKTDPSTKSTKPSKGYNPFDDDDDDVAADSSAEKDNKPGYNPFDDDDNEEDATETNKNAKKKTSGVIKRQVSYPHHYNPFEEGADDKSNANDEGSQRTKPKEKKETKDTVLNSTTKSYNPFEDDDNDDESLNDNKTAVQGNSTRKSSTERKTNVNRVAQSGTSSPSAALKPAETSAKKRRAPPPPAVRSSDDPWTARLPTEVTPARQRRSRPTETSGEQQTSPNASPAKRAPKRAAPAPPRRPPLIPSFDEWKSEQTDGDAAGDNERPAVSSTGDTHEKSESSGGASPKAAPKNSTTDAANQADIKLLARQVLMDARKKAGASGALPRERVAEIAKASKGPTADKATADKATADKATADKATANSDEREGGPQGKEMVDDEEALRKKENLRQRKEELLRRKKATEKAQKMVQNAVDKERAQKQPSSPQQTISEQTNQESSTGGINTDSTSGDQKTAGNKNLQHRPLKLKDKENDENRRKLSPPPKNEFKESDELQRIRQVLNQGKKDRKSSNSDNSGQDKNSLRAQSPKPSQEGSRKISHGKSSKHSAVNGVKNIPDPTAPPRPKARGANAGLHAYVKSRKMNFEAFEVPSDQAQQGDKQENIGTQQGVQDNDTKDDSSKDEVAIIDDEGRESGEPSQDLQDASDYVREELEMLEEQQKALDKVGEKLEIELRRAMQTKGCEDEREKLMQEWFLLVNKKNELVRRQGELNLLKNEEDLERSKDMLQRELRAILELEDWQKTEEQKDREAKLIDQLVSVVNKRDQLVQFEDSQLYQAEQDALHVQKVIASARLSKDKNECVLQ